MILEKIDSGEVGIKDLNNIDLNSFSVEELQEMKSQCEVKTAFWNTNQMALKISMNSLYGALSNQYFVLFNRDIAASITGNGRIYIRALSLHINKKLNDMFRTNKEYIVYNDTDSAYVNLADVADLIIQQKFENKFEDMELKEKEDFLDVLLIFVEKHVDKWVDEFTAEYAQKFNSFDESAIGAKLEKIMDKSLFTDKKRYAVRAVYDEGDIRLRNPKIAPTGLETVRSSTPALCRIYLKDALGYLMDESEDFIQKFIADVKVKFYNAPVDEIARVSGVSNLKYDFNGEKFTTVNENGKTLTAPIASRAALLHNRAINKYELTSTYEEIKESDKIKYVYLKLPNQVNANVFGFKDERILQEFGLYKYLDYDEMFEKFFLQPMKSMMEVIGYSAEKKSSIDEWF